METKKEAVYLNQVYIPQSMNDLLDEIARVHRLVEGLHHRRKKSDILLDAFKAVGGIDYLLRELDRTNQRLSEKPKPTPGRRGRRKKVVVE